MNDLLNQAGRLGLLPSPLCTYLRVAAPSLSSRAPSRGAPQLARLFIPAWDCLTPSGYRRTHHQTRLLAWKVVPAGEQNPALPLSCRSSQSVNASAVAYEERMDRQTPGAAKR